MELRLPFDEISDMIEKKAGRRLPLCYGGPHTVRVSYDVNVLFKTTSVGIDLTVESIEGNDIVLSYNGGAGIDFMVKQALNMAKSRPGGELIELEGDNRIRLALSKQPQAGTLLEKIELRDIRFDEKYGIIDFMPRMA